MLLKERVQVRLFTVNFNFPRRIREQIGFPNSYR